MITTLSILGIIVFIGGAYFMGNKVLDTLSDDWREQIMSTIYGFLMWILILLVAVMCIGIYHGIGALANAL